MKKYILLLIIVAGLCSCDINYQRNLNKMGDAVRQHIRYRDADNGTITKIGHFVPVSYEKIPEDKRQKPDEVYLFRVYIQGTWSYDNSYRIYNINDTVNYYFDSNRKVLRMDENKEQ
jgi:hypothetical protein